LSLLRASMSCFVTSQETGQTREFKCRTCQAIVVHAELRMTSDGQSFLRWVPIPHRAPCGAHCAAGGVQPFENDVHGLPIGFLSGGLAQDSNGTCPRCNRGSASPNAGCAGQRIDQ
jgi:hypothetical protein